MGSVPLLTREEEVEISKRIEKAQIQIEKIIMRFRYSTREAISIANYLITSKERFDKIIAEKEVSDKNALLCDLLPRLAILLNQEDRILKIFLRDLYRSRDKKIDKVKIAEEIEKCRIRTQAYLATDALPPQYHRRLRRSHPHLLRSLFDLEKEMQELTPARRKK